MVAVSRKSSLSVRKNTGEKKKNNKMFGIAGRPLEEVDPFVFEETFCIIAKKFGKYNVYRFSASHSLFIFGPLNPIRKLTCRIITNVLFDVFIIVVILANCCMLGVNTNYEIDSTGDRVVDEERARVINIMEYVFLGLYTLEMITKIIAKGLLVNKFSYLRNLWNILDFVVVTSGYVAIGLAFSVSDVSLDFLSTLRVLRAVKTISVIPGLKLMINALLKSVTQLVEVMILTLFCLMIFSLLALQLFMGKMSHKCVLIKGSALHSQMIFEEESRDLSEVGPIKPDEPYANYFWYGWVMEEQNWYQRIDDYPIEEYQPCANRTGRDCPEGYVCLADIGQNFDDGWTSFDNFFSSMLTTFQLLTTDFWERPYDLIVSTTSPFSVLFCMIVIFLGFFYLLNLLLAVVAMSYEEEYQQETQVVLTKHQKLRINRTASTFSFEDPVSLNLNLLTHYKKRTVSEREMLARTLREHSDTSVKGEDAAEDKQQFQTMIMTLLGRRASAPQNVNERKSRTSESHPALESSTSTVARESKDGPRVTDVRTATESLSEDGYKKENSLDSRNSRVKSLAQTAKTVASAANTSCIRCSKCLACVRLYMQPMVRHSAFEVVITTLIIINTVLLASEHHNQPTWLDRILVIGNYFFTAVFVIEAIIKLFALQHQYFRSSWNVFDLVVVVMSLMDFALDVANLTVLRSVRLLRIFKLAQSWITMKVLMNIIVATFGALGNLTIIILIVIYIFAVLGLQIIGKFYTKKAFEAEEDLDKFPRWNFTDFRYAFMMVFRVLCGEWIEPLLDCLKATSSASKGDSYKCFLIFLPIFIVGNLIVLNLFLALLLNSFDTEELETRRLEELEASKKDKNMKQVLGRIFSAKPAAKFSGDSADISAAGSDVSTIPSTQQQALNRFRQASKRIISMNRKNVARKMIERASLKSKQVISTRKNVQKEVSIKSKNTRSSKTMETESEDNTLQIKDPEPCMPRKCWQLNCCFFRCCRKLNWNCWDGMRKIIVRMVTHPIFEWFILALIFASSITLCFEDVNLEKRKTLKDALFYINTGFTLIFVVEMILKWIGLGLWEYFTNTWTILDCFIVIISMSAWINDVDSRMTGKVKEGNNFAALKALRTLRALRPLRAISRWQGMKMVVNALMYAIPSIVNVLLVCLLFWLVFAIMGVQFFKGRFYRCVQNEDGEMVDSAVVKTKEECCNETNRNRYSWINQTPNFDHVFAGYLTLFQVATFEGWMEAMQASVDVQGIDKQPVRDGNLSAYIFYVVFIVFGSFFTLNLFIGVIIDNFNRLKKKYEGKLVEILLTPSQRHYYTAMKKLSQKKPKRVIRRPRNKFIALLYDISMSRKFEISLFVLIFLNMIIMAFTIHNQSELYVNILDAFNSFFTFVYVLEAIIKISGLGKYYFTIPWNLFDLVLVIASMTDIIVGDFFSEIVRIPPTMLRIVRVFRIGRVLRLIKAAKGIRKLLFALVVSLPALFNIGALLCLITFIYAILGMALFSGIAKNEAIDDIFNFDTFGNSCMVLLRLMIMAAGWNDVLSSMTVETPECGGQYRNIQCGNAEEGEGTCPNFFLAVAYMVTFLIITDLIVLNMYVAIILENFYDASREEEIGIVEDDLDMFYVKWSRYDPQATQFIDFDQLSDFLNSLDPPLRIAKPNIVAIVAFNMPIAQGNKIHCLDILHSLIKHVVGEVDDSAEFRKMQEGMEHTFRKQFPTRKLLDIISSTRVWKIQQNAAIIIQRAWRAYRAQKFPPDHENDHDHELLHVTQAHVPKHRSSPLTIGRRKVPLERVNFLIPLLLSAEANAETVKK